ncbi:MAG: DUF1592 domain-containing protein [Planctomycetaceae bacterium]|nr:DUF1592 domain-containing protein [Planctomycetaceae bacterium]
MFRARQKLIFLLIASVCWSGFCNRASAEESASPGQKIYQKLCLDCHGEQGQGVESVYPQPLIGDLSVNELTTYIEKTMPEGEPEKCVGEDASAVAGYIHEAFYSITAQARNRKARIDLARLTVPQYQNSVTDLVQSFTWRRSLGDKRGLEADYFKSRRRNRENQVLERTDGRVDFDFGEKPAFLADLIAKEEEARKAAADKEDKEDEEKKEKDEDPPVQEEYSVTWNGSLYAPETGEYVLNLKTENSGRLWFNTERDPLIDARVKSGDQTDYTTTIKMQAGRLYSLRLEYFKNKTEKTGFVQLRWKRPHQTEEVIAERYLIPENSPWSLVVETPFPPDDKSVGYERGTSVSQEWNNATTFAAIEVADKVLKRINELAKLPKEEDKHAEHLRQFCEDFAERAFRRPLSEEETQLYIDRQFDQAENPLTAVKRVIILTLKSPRFLFPGAAEQDFDDFRVAEWLALALWDSIPDEQLFQAAAQGNLSSREQIESQVQRMLRDDRARVKLQGFFHQWLNVDHFHDLSKSNELYPGYDAKLLSDLRTSLDLFLERVVLQDDSDYRNLLTSTEYPLNRKLAEYYGMPQPSGEDFEFVSFEPESRAGLLTHPFLLTGLAYDDASSPIHRGVFLSRSLLGRFLKPPPEAVAPLPVDLHPDMTTRERVAMQTSSATCMACHGMINQLGFTLENFDAVGRFRQQEHGKPVNSLGLYLDRDGEKAELEGARGLADYLISSDAAHNAFVEQMFQYLNKQPIQAFAPKTLQKLRSEFEDSGFHIRKLMGNIALESVLVARKLEQAEN